ncbi:hypothetical protein OG723_35745 [Streptomyces sp. NBC_01278]|uniref:hypothetical protein n=1 Tax=Streptomyces sp. NBC_01278 TaxID=2903809 RepID=UPI002E3375E9|nr:hypothetical protein [Streptomyces sp. NBC_01278]
MDEAQAKEWQPGTAQDLVRDAEALGIEQVSTRMITDWVEVGLLAAPEFQKSTQRGRDHSVFPALQRRLFTELLEARRRSPLKRIPHHTMIPVVLFVWLTSDTIVPASQARRALRTYAQTTGKTNKTRRQDNARRIVDQFAHPSATYHQRRTAQLLIEEGERTRNPDWGKLHSALTTLCSPWRTAGLPLLERGIGRPDIPLTVTDSIVISVAVQQVTAWLRAEQVREEDLLEARRLHRIDWAQYEAARSQQQPEGTTAGFFAIPEGMEARVREQVHAYTGTLAGMLGVIAEVAARARVGRHPF